MLKHKQFRRWCALFAVLSVFFLGSAALVGVKAGSPEDDGWINKLPWVNSFGAIAVYCVDQNDHPGDNFTGGGIKILNSTGQRIFFAPEAEINPARVLANEKHQAVFIHHQSYYSLYALPEGYFQINTPPDIQGNVVLAIWKDCAGPRPGLAPSPTPLPRPIIR